VIVLDHTTAPLTATHPLLVDLAVHAPTDDRDLIVVPLLCLTGAAAAQSELALGEALGGLVGVDFAALDFPAFHHCELQARAGVPWEVAHVVHVVHAAGPGDHDRADSVVVTTSPQLYTGLGVTAVDIAEL
jgi:hypothetical protein